MYLILWLYYGINHIRIKSQNALVGNTGVVITCVDDSNLCGEDSNTAYEEDLNTAYEEDLNTTCEEDLNTTREEDSNTTCDEDLNTICDEVLNTTYDTDSNTAWEEDMNTCEENLSGSGEEDNPVKEDGRRSGHNYIPTMDACVMREAKDTQGINSGRSSNVNISSDILTIPCNIVVYHRTTLKIGDETLHFII